MRVQDIMTVNVETTAPATSAEEAWAAMKRQSIRHLIVKEGSRLVGVLSTRDLGGERGAALRRDRTVADLMATHVATVSAAETVRKAANIMRGRTIGSLVVVDGRRPVGIVTMSDLLDVLGHGGGRGAVQRPLLNHRVPHRKRHFSTGPW
jgi:CBS domain-containing protein